ncbi:MAG: 50S ribosomal protein L30 [Candidatus Methanofastidiosia archaeon]|jgi:large subunit ribosomal protein L30
MNRIIAVRVRGTAKVSKSIRDTLTMLNLTKPHHAVVIDDRPTYMGMLKKAKDYLTYGEVEPDVVEALVRKWGRLPGGTRLTEEYVKENTGQTIKAFVKSVIQFEKELDELKIKNMFRLHPPRKGYKNIKLAYTQGGSLGYRGKDINALVRRMI